MLPRTPEGTGASTPAAGSLLVCGSVRAQERAHTFARERAYISEERMRAREPVR